MKAVRWHARGDARVDEVDDPGPPGPGDVLLRVLLCGVCGTDLDEVGSARSRCRRTGRP